MSTAIDYAGKKIGKLTVIELVKVRDAAGITRRKWRCSCDCGKEIIVISSSLAPGNITSCGCLRIEAITTHGQSNTGEFRSWSHMLQRCTNPRHDRYPDWGGRGIAVCDRWMKFENFLADMGQRPSPSHSIDRKDNDGNYEPGNCRWATRSEQQRNKRVCKSSKSGGRNVYIDQRRNNFAVRLKRCGKYVSVGTFRTIDEAVSARDAFIAENG